MITPLSLSDGEARLRKRQAVFFCEWPIACDLIPLQLIFGFLLFSLASPLASYVSGHTLEVTGGSGI
jgi:hypothetical protein